MEMRSMEGANFNDAPDERDASAMVQVVHCCAKTVNRGSPLYNSGAVRECADLYAQTLTRLINAETTPPETKAIFKEALQSAIGIVSASRRAWILRQAFDQVIQLAVTPPHSQATCSHHDPATGWEQYDRAPSRRRGSTRDSRSIIAVTSRIPAPFAIDLDVDRRGRHESHASSTSSCSKSSSKPSKGQRSQVARGFQLLALPDDLSALVLAELPARELASLCGTCEGEG